MRICILASGSRGNATLIECGDRRILIDAGLSAREIERRLNQIERSAQQLDAVLVTHEHRDHVTGLGPLVRRYGLPLYLNARTLEAIPKLGAVKQLHQIVAGESFAVADLQVEGFSTSHDAADPLGYVINSSEGRIGYVTDLGLATRLVVDRLQECRVLILEANHDEQMLIDGPYPWPLKQRIQGRHGHLSNLASADLLQRLAWPGLEAVFVAHLSEENNQPQRVEESFRRCLQQCDGCSPQLILGCQTQVSACFDAEFNAPTPARETTLS